MADVVVVFVAAHNHTLVDVVVAACHPSCRSCCCWDDHHGVDTKGDRNGDEADGLGSLNVVAVAFDGGEDPFHHISLVADHLLRVVVVDCVHMDICWTVVEIVVVVSCDDVWVHFPHVHVVVVVGSDAVLGIAL